MRSLTVRGQGCEKLSVKKRDSHGFITHSGSFVIIGKPDGPVGDWSGMLWLTPLKLRKFGEACIQIAKELEADND